MSYSLSYALRYVVSDTVNQVCSSRACTDFCINL